MTEQYARAWIQYSDGTEELIDALDFSWEWIEKDEFIYRTGDWFPPKREYQVRYYNSHGAKVTIELPHDAVIKKTFIEGDIWWLEKDGERASAYFDNLELALQLKTAEDQIKGGFVTTVNPNKAEIVK